MSAEAVAAYDGLADRYEHEFAAPHRRAYDDLAWERVRAALPPAPATVVDAGCGVGRWAPRLVALGHRVVGIEQAPRMAARARATAAALPPGAFRVVEAPMQEVDLPAASVGAVLAMGSVQYTPDPPAALARMASWVRTGGVVCALVDSRLALGLELAAAGRVEEAAERLATGRGVWRVGGVSVAQHLFDRAGLSEALRGAGLVDVTVSGLLVGMTAFGRPTLLDRLSRDYDAALAVERTLAGQDAAADAGKQLLGIGRRPVEAAS